MPPAGPGDDANPYASQGGDMVPPADIGDPSSTAPARPKRTTLLDLIMGQ
jgi:penicillin-binding protein 1A